MIRNRFSRASGLGRAWLGASALALTAALGSAARAQTLAPPSNLTARIVPEGIVLNWRDNSQGEQGFIVERQVPAYGDVFARIFVGQTPNQTTFLDSNFLAGTTYNYRVRAYRGSVESAPSNVASVSPTANPVPTTSIPAQEFFATNGSGFVSFNTSNPGVLRTRPIRGLSSGVILLGLDTRVAPSTTSGNGVVGVYALGSNSTLYLLDTSGTGAVTATAVGGPFAFSNFTPFVNVSYGFDFNPVPDRIRVVNSANQNFRLNPNTGAAVDGDANPENGVNPDPNLAFDAGDVNAGREPNVVGAAYTNNDQNPATGTINYAIDFGVDALVTQGRPDPDGEGPGTAVSPNTGRLFTVGSLGVNATNITGFEIYGAQNTAVASLRVNGQLGLYSINLTTGAATLVGTLGQGDAFIGSIAVAPPTNSAPSTSPTTTNPS